MPTIIGVQFRQAGKIYFFSPNNLDPVAGAHVIVETSRGIEYATVKQSRREVSEDDIVTPLKEIIRIATPEDDAIHEANLRKAEEAKRICHEKIHEHALEMKLIDVEYTFDNNKIIFYFTADGRVDFRDLVKDLAGIFHTRIELRQIGVRDEAKIVGGVGICGLPLCCHRFIGEFSPVSIKMAKEQNLSLNPGKISGCCGRLLCCLNYENDHYVEANRLNAQAQKAKQRQAEEASEETLIILEENTASVLNQPDEPEKKPTPPRRNNPKKPRHTQGKGEDNRNRPQKDNPKPPARSKKSGKASGNPPKNKRTNKPEGHSSARPRANVPKSGNKKSHE